MANKKECLSCNNLVREIKQLSIKRKDGGYETACAYSCKARKMPLPTLSKHDADGCVFYDKRDN